jgi:hypothetical protein
MRPEWEPTARTHSSRHIWQAGAAGTVRLVASCGKEPVVSANSIRVDWCSFAVGFFRTEGLNRGQFVRAADYWDAPRTVCRTLAGGDNPRTRHPIPSFVSPGGANPPPHQGGRGSVWALTGGLRRPAILRRPCRDRNGCPTDSERRPIAQLTGPPRRTDQFVQGELYRSVDRTAHGLVQSAESALDQSFVQSLDDGLRETRTFKNQARVELHQRCTRSDLFPRVGRAVYPTHAYDGDGALRLSVEMAHNLRAALAQRPAAQTAGFGVAPLPVRIGHRRSGDRSICCYDPSHASRGNQRQQLVQGFGGKIGRHFDEHRPEPGC